MNDKAVHHSTIGSQSWSLVWGLVFSFLFTANWADATPQLSLQQIFKENAPAVAVIRIMDAAGKQLALGSGFVTSPSSVIVTNHHVIAPIADGRLVVKLPNGDTYEDVWVIHAEERRDFAVLAIKASGLTTVRLGDSDKVEVGEQVVALGSPQGLEQTFTVGIVSHIRPDPRRGIRRIQHQAPISKGSSGGPLFNMKGEVIGINTWSVEEGQNLNLAVPVNYVKAYLQDPPKMTYEQYARSRGVPMPEERKPSTALKTYRNEKYGFSFKYPEVWDAIKQQDSKEHESGVEWFFQHAKVERFGRDSFTLKVRPLPGSKEGAPLDLAKAVETHFKSRFGTWKDSATGFSVPPTELISGEGYAGYYFVYYTPLFAKTSVERTFLHITGTIYTKSFVYELSTLCPHPAEHAESRQAFANVIKSFEFTKPRLPSPPPVAWKTYRNDKYGMSFEYPEYWKFEEVMPQVMELRRKFSGDLLAVWGEAKIDDSVPGIEVGESSFAKLEVVVRDAKESDFEKAARQDYEKQATSQFPKTISNEFFKGNGYAGTHWIYRHPGSPHDSVTIRIYTKAFVYVLEGYASKPSVGSYYRGLIKKVFESFKFPT